MQNGHTIHSITSLSGNSAEMPDRTNGLSLLPVSSKDEDGRTKEELHKLDGRMRDEFHKLLNGNTVDATDRVLQNLHNCFGLVLEVPSDACVNLK